MHYIEPAFFYLWDKRHFSKKRGGGEVSLLEYKSSILLFCILFYTPSITIYHLFFLISLQNNRSVILKRKKKKKTHNILQLMENSIYRIQKML